MSFGFGLAMPVGGGVPLAAAISGIFADGTQGAWYDPSDQNPTWRRNLLTYTEQFDNAAWTVGNLSVAANQTTAPDGTNTADAITEGSALSNVSISQTISVGANTQYTLSAYAKPKSGSRYLTLSVDADGSNWASVTFDLVTGSVTQSLQSTYSAPTGSVVSASNGFFRCAMSVSVGATAPTSARLSLASSGTFASFSRGRQGYQADGTSGIYIWGAQLEQAATASTYQQIVTPEITYVATIQPQPILYQDSAGTTPVTAVEQPVGLMLDKSKGLVLGSEIRTSSWTPSAGTVVASGGGTVLTFTSANATNADLAENTGTITSGVWYKATATISSFVGGGVSFSVGTVSQGAVYSANGTYEQVFLATQTGPFQIRSRLATTTLVVSNISVRELPGNHAYQSTSASRPTYSRRINLLTYTEQFDNAAWLNNGVTVTPNVFGTFDKLVENTANSSHSTQQLFTFIANQSYTMSVKAKQGTGSRYLTLNVAGGAPGAGFDLINGTLLNTFVGGQTNVSASITKGADGVCTCTLSFTNSLLLGASQYRVCLSNTAASAEPAYTGDGVSSILVGEASLVPANLATLPYQRVVTSTDYNADPTLFPAYLRADGTDDGMLTNSINFTSTDKMFVGTAVRKLSDAAVGIVVEFSQTSVSNNGAFYIANSAATPASYRFASRGTSLGLADSTGPSSPVSNVLSGIGNISGDSAVLRIDGTQAASSSADQGTGNFGNYPLYLFRRAGTTLPFNGWFYGSVIAGKTLTASQISAVERYLALETKTVTV